MRAPLGISIAVFCLLTSSALAADRDTIGWGRIFTNDYIGDGSDRWRTGSYAISRVQGPEWTGQRSTRFGETTELRLRSEIIAPEDLSDPDETDRRYVGVLSIGVHSHWRRDGTELSIGGDLVFTGPQTGVGSLQETLHEWVGLPEPNAQEDQIGNAVYPTLLGEVAQPYWVGPMVTLRPFVEAQAGAETLVRLGGDMIVGNLGHEDLLIRDVSTGHLIRTARTRNEGLAFVLGGDVAHMTDSAYLREEDGFRMVENRHRLRAGVHWQGQDAGFFYGLTWLGEEFEAQPDTQVAGSLRVYFNF